MNRYFIVMILILLKSQSISTDRLFNFIVWDVGQGQWTTFIDHNQCLHFDMGGEKYPKKLTELCRRKLNILFITHEDWDHVSFISTFSRKTENFCFFNLKPPKRTFLKRLKKCDIKLPKVVSIISKGLSGRSANEESSVFLLNNQILQTGDAPQSEEKRWLYKLPKKIKLLILGHHGSNTSTSNSLLEHIKIKMAVASSRKKRYGHPHPKVIDRLKNKKIPLLSTENMGSLYFWIK